MMSSGLAEYSLFTATNKLEINIQFYGDPSSVFRGGTRGAVWNQREPTRHLAFSSFPSGLLHAVEHNGETRFLIVLHVWEYIWLSTQKKGPRSLQAADTHRRRKLEVLAHFYTGVKPDWKVTFLFFSGTQKKKKNTSQNNCSGKRVSILTQVFLAWLQPTGVGGVSTSHQAGANQTARAAAFTVPDSHFGQTGIRGNVSWDQPILCKITPADAFFMKAFFQKYWLINLSQAHSSVFLRRRLRYSPRKSNILKSLLFFFFNVIKRKIGFGK